MLLPGRNKRFGRARPQKHPFFNRSRALIAMLAIALLDLPNHQRNHLDHGDPAHSCCRSGNPYPESSPRGGSSRPASSAAPPRWDCTDNSGPRRNRCPERGPTPGCACSDISPASGEKPRSRRRRKSCCQGEPSPSSSGNEKNFCFRYKARRLLHRADQRSGIGGTYHGARIRRHRAAIPVANLALENLARGIVLRQIAHEFRQLNAGLAQELQHAGSARRTARCRSSDSPARARRSGWRPAASAAAPSPAPANTAR